jgi:hypothetical protein
VQRGITRECARTNRDVVVDGIQHDILAHRGVRRNEMDLEKVPGYERKENSAESLEKGDSECTVGSGEFL